MSELNLLYVHGGALGYGRYGVHLAKELAAAGVDIYDHLPGTAEDHLNTGSRSKACSTVCWISVPTHARGWWKGQRPVISTMWEATVLPESFRETIHEFERVIVPSEHNVELFSKYHSNVRYVPLGVEPADWYFIPRPQPETQFRFLIGGSGARKGTDLAHKAFRLAFPEGSWGDGPIPTLVMKNPKGEPFHGSRIEMVTGRLSAQDEIDLYASAHCYLQPSRGEGFGLQPLQAIAQGIPTILTDAHGHAAFAHLGIPLDSTMTKADYFIYGDAGEWWEPDLDQLVSAMRWVYDNYAAACEWAETSARVVSKEFTWEQCARRFVTEIGDLDTPFTGDGSWHQPETRRFLVVTNTDWTADIAGTLYHFRKGEEYRELADVKRILFEAGLLDPACIVDDDCGLSESQAARVAGYTAAHSHCPTCHQPLNSQPTRADELLEAMS